MNFSYSEYSRDNGSDNRQNNYLRNRRYTVFDFVNFLKGPGVPGPYFENCCSLLILINSDSLGIFLI